jgi:hypothetical protein
VISDSKSGNYFRRSGNLSNLDRAYTVKKKEQNKIAVEIGRKGDIAPENLVGKSTFMQVADAQNAQEAIWLRRDVSTPLKAEAFSQNNYNFQVIIDYDFANKNYEDSLAGERYEKKLCNLSQTLNADFFTIGREELGGSLRPPTRFRHFYSIGARTVSVATDDPVRELLLEPWNHSGFMLAPMIVGYPDVYLIRYKGGKS